MDTIRYIFFTFYSVLSIFFALVGDINAEGRKFSPVPSSCSFFRACSISRVQREMIAYTEKVNVFYNHMVILNKVVQHIFQFR